MRASDRSVDRLGVLHRSSYLVRMNKPTILIREHGGLGDVLMHRLIFEALAKRYGPITFACPSKFHEVLTDHPYLSNVIECDGLDVDLLREEFTVFNTSTICRQHEASWPRSSRSRPDIWAGWCGVRLNNPSMYLRPSSNGRDFIGSGQVAMLAPVSANEAKNLLPRHVVPVVEFLRGRGFRCLGLHSEPIPWLEAAGVPTLTGLTLPQWLASLAAADLVVSTDTAAFHAAGGLSVACVGIFANAVGSVMAKHYPRASVVQVSRDLVPCAPCNNLYACPFAGLPKPCLDRLAADRIVEAVRAAVDSPRLGVGRTSKPCRNIP